MDRRGYRRLCSEQKMGLSVKQTDSRRVFLLCCSTIYHTARRKRSALACRRSIITFFDRLKINRKRRNRDRKDERVRFLTFSRNFGKEAAMYAGLQNASGDYCVFMDADLQHPPALLKNMYHAVKYEGYDCCAGLREDRTGENPIRTFLSRSFYHLIGNACHLDMGDGKGDFRMMNRAMTDSILELKEYNRYMKGIFSFVGFDTKWIPFHNTERAAGKTKWNFRSLFRYAMDGMLSFSSAPASLPGFIGMFLLIAAVVTGLVSVFTGHKANWILLLVCLILALNGIQMIFLSLLGQYMSKDYMESKKRPIYIIKKKGGF